MKYRGKRTDNGEWVYGYYYYSARYSAHFIKISEEYENGDFVEYDVEVIPETVGAFIGKSDETGKDMYVGDIIEDIIGKFRSQIYEYEGRYVGGPTKRIISDTPHTRRKKVIGNIFDNLELMDGDKVKVY